MTTKQINALDETVTKPRDEWTENHSLAFIAAWRRADPATRKQILGILNGTIDLAAKVWLPTAEAETKAVAHVKR
jgi:hypothetical protein